MESITSCFFASLLCVCGSRSPPHCFRLFIPREFLFLIFLLLFFIFFILNEPPPFHIKTNSLERKKKLKREHSTLLTSHQSPAPSAQLPPAFQLPYNYYVFPLSFVVNYSFTGSKSGCKQSREPLRMIISPGNLGKVERFLCFSAKKREVAFSVTR